MTQTPLERAARALCEANGDAESYWHSYVSPARAVLMAVREPSDAMLEAGKAAMGGGPNDPTEGDAWNCHEAMIDAALFEKTI